MYKVILLFLLASCSKEEITEPTFNKAQYTQSLTYAVDSFTHTWKLVKTDTTSLHYHSLEQSVINKYKDSRDTIICGSLRIGRWIVAPDSLMHKK